MDKMDKYLNIVSLNVPWPANYGGIIDIFYKLEALYCLGVKIILHAFEYERPPAPELDDYCEKVYYYKRHTGIIPNLSALPYNVISRKDPLLLERLLGNDYPILFEGLHSCYYLGDERLKDRMKIVRSANIEHYYYFHLYKAEKNILKRTFFLTESRRFASFEKQIRHADLTLAISTTDEKALKARYPESRVEFVPAFHANVMLNPDTGISNYILYHAKLSVVENEKAVVYLINNVFAKLKQTCIIAGMNPSSALIRVAKRYANIRIEANPNNGRMDWLIRNAQVHVLVTFQATGLKLKLLNSLFAGRHVLVNRLMVEGSGLDSLCHLADSPEEMVNACGELMRKPFTSADIEKRKAVLIPFYDNISQAERLIGLIYGSN